MKFLIGILFLGVALAAQEECGENAHFTNCGTACPLTCDNLEDPPKFCVAMCVSGCYCDEGFVKTSSGSCVKPEGCPKTRVDRLARACKDKKNVGPCRGAFPRFYFNQQTGQCEGFTYGGCQGNSNNFNSKEDCEAVCIN